MSQPEAAVAGGVHKACSVPVQRAASPMMDEVVGGDCSPGDAQLPSLPLVWGLRRLVGDEQVVPAERTATVLPG